MTGEERFWQLAEELQQSHRHVAIGTIMSSRCLRIGKEFLAFYDGKRKGLVVKLAKERVERLVEEGHGEPFAPAGKVFNEWVLVPDPSRRRWPKLLREGVAFGERS